MTARNRLATARSGALTLAGAAEENAMKRVNILVAIAVLLLGLHSGAHAADLVTPLLGLSEVVCCEVSNSNASLGNIIVRARILDLNGTLLDDTGDFTLSPGHGSACAAQVSAGIGYHHPVYCRVTTNGLAATRVSFTHYDSSGNPQATVNAR